MIIEEVAAECSCSGQCCCCIGDAGCVAAYGK